MLKIGRMDIGRHLPGSVLSLNLKSGMMCAILINLGNTPTVNGSLIILDSLGDEIDLVDLLSSETF